MTISTKWQYFSKKKGILAFYFIYNVEILNYNESILIVAISKQKRGVNEKRMANL
jgi:hypothetical protein